MADDLYFDGDPAEDSNRRRLERVIKGGPPRRRWPWVMAILAGGAWTAWRMTHPKGPQPPEAVRSQPDRHDPEKTTRG
jgi:hypothetical protein